MRVQLKLFVATVNGYFYSAYNSESVSILKTKSYMFFSKIYSFLFSFLFFYNFNSRTSYIPTINFKRTKKVSRYIVPSLFASLPIFNIV